MGAGSHTWFLCYLRQRLVSWEQEILKLSLPALFLWKHRNEAASPVGEACPSLDTPYAFTVSNFS